MSSLGFYVFFCLSAYESYLAFLLQDFPFQVTCSPAFHTVAFLRNNGLVLGSGFIRSSSSTAFRPVTPKSIIYLTYTIKIHLLCHALHAPRRLSLRKLGSSLLTSYSLLLPPYSSLSLWGRPHLITALCRILGFDIYSSLAYSIPRNKAAPKSGILH